MKRKIMSKIIFIFVISNILIFSSFSNNVKGIPNDINFIFLNDIIYENNSITSYQTPFNLRYQERYTQLYNASYSFTDDIDSSEPLGWDVVDNIDTSAQVISNLSLHSKVFEIFDGSNIAGIQSITAFPSGTVFGTYEFWFRTNDTSQDGTYLYGGNQDLAISMRASVHDNDFYINPGGSGEFVVVSATSNQWYHLRFDFEFGGGGYEGLAPDTFYWYINGIQYGAYNMETIGTSIGNFRSLTLNPNADFKSYIDGFGLSWYNNYTINKNLLPFLNKSTTLMEIDRYEFAMSDIDTFYPTGADNSDGWTDIEVGGGDKVGIAVQGNVNGLVYSDTTVITDERGIEKSFGISGNLLNVSFSILPEVMDGGANHIYTVIDSLDTNELTIIRLTAGGNIYYSDLGGGFLLFTSTFTLLRTYEFNLLINNETNRVFTIIKENGVVIETKDYPTIAPARNGIQDIQIYSLSIDNNRVSYFIDYVGVYNNGTPQVGLNDSFGLSTILLEGVSNWNYEHNNLFSIIANGTFHLGAVDGGNYFRGSTLLVIKNTSIYVQNETAFFNIYDNFVSEVSIPRLVFTLVSGSFNVSYLKINGVLLNETGTSNSYHLDFTYGNVDISESYFYVSGNKLRFIHNSNDTNLEFIQARFSIEQVSSSDISVSFNSVIQNNALGFFRVNFTDTSNLIQIGNIERTLRFILSQNLTINDLIILVSDVDDNTVSGSTTGFVDNIKFLITANISASIITDSLINMMIPLIMIIIPTLALSNRYGKNIIIPMFLLMSIICLASSLIPVWLFFVIAISCSLFIIKRDEIR